MIGCSETNGITVASVVLKASGKADLSPKELHETLQRALPDVTVDYFNGIYTIVVHYGHTFYPNVLIT